MIPILLYHQVADLPAREDPLGLAMPPARFDAQMGYLSRRGFRCLTLAEAVEVYRAGKRPPAGSFVLTFDDGYRDVHLTACPILEKYGFRATVFLVGGYMGRLSAWWSQEGSAAGQMMDWDEARDLARRGFTLGSHTLNHPWLNLLDDSSALEEIQGSKLYLEEHMGAAVNYFSYPYSSHDARLQAMAASAGYTAACGGDQGPWSIYNLWRVPCLRFDTSLAFALKTGGWYDRRTVLKESAAGQYLRRCLHAARRRLKIKRSQRQGVLDPSRAIQPGKRS